MKNEEKKEITETEPKCNNFRSSTNAKVPIQAGRQQQSQPIRNLSKPATSSYRFVQYV